jgi:hypothetical protein
MGLSFPGLAVGSLGSDDYCVHLPGVGGWRNRIGQRDDTFLERPPKVPILRITNCVSCVCCLCHVGRIPGTKCPTKSCFSLQSTRVDDEQKNPTPLCFCSFQDCCRQGPGRIKPPNVEESTSGPPGSTAAGYSWRAQSLARGLCPTSSRPPSAPITRARRMNPNPLRFASIFNLPGQNRGFCSLRKFAYFIPSCYQTF